MKIFKTIVKNGMENGMETYIDCCGVAKNAKEFTEMYGKGETKPKDVTKEYFVSPREGGGYPGGDSVSYLIDVLTRNGWGAVEVQFIGELLDEELKKQGR